MNLWLRLVWYAMRVRFMAALSLPADSSVLTFRVWPGDLDLSLHMICGRYLTLMDIGRLDIMARSGLLRPLLNHG